MFCFSNIWPCSPVVERLNRNRKGHGFKSRRGLKFHLFPLNYNSFSCCITPVISFSLIFFTTVHMNLFSHTHYHSQVCKKQIGLPNLRKRDKLLSTVFVHGLLRNRGGEGGGAKKEMGKRKIFLVTELSQLPIRSPIKSFYAWLTSRGNLLCLPPSVN